MMTYQENNNTQTESITQGLNPQQKHAVTQPFDRHCLVLAGAGCGKTSVLTRRIAYCACQYCPQDRILALTFTRKAAEEMQKRLVSLPGISRDDPLPLVTTFHGYGLRIVKDTIRGESNFKRLGFSGEPDLLTGRERLALLAGISTREQRRALYVTITELDDLLARQAVHPQKNSSLPDESRAVLAELAKRFTEIKQQRNRWEFSDMITLVLRLFAENPAVARVYARRFSAILVDEFQDTNPLQIAMLKNMLSPANSLFAVGDDDQAIYGFRGADIGPIMHFNEHFKDANIVKLETNYRSTPAILAAANRIFKDKPHLYRKILQSGKYETGGKGTFPRPRKKFFPAATDMVAWIQETGAGIMKNEGIPVSEMAVLFRLNETMDYVCNALEKRASPSQAMPRCLTVHGSKGLEFPVVFLCDLEESVFPHYPIKRSKKIRSWLDLINHIINKRKDAHASCDFNEEKRLFYVGVTRAERYLFLLSIKRKVINGKRIGLEPSRFLTLI